MFDRCTFGLMTVERGDWSFVDLPGAALTRATLTAARMRQADLRGSTSLRSTRATSS
jgi:uncharacterized protein YjbI with pentapeptide repeats